jgi:hypothetical protein
MAMDVKTKVHAHSTTAPMAVPLDQPPLLEVVGGLFGPDCGHADGSLDVARFVSPMGLCLWDGRVIVADCGSHSIRLIEDAVDATSALVARISARIAEAVSDLPKELIAITAHYARPTGVRTIAGRPGVSGFADGSALGNSQFSNPSAVAIDDTDPVAGPQLIISDYNNHAIRCLNLRSEQVTTIGGFGKGHRDGPARDALFASPIGLAVAPSGVIFVADQVSGAPLSHLSSSLSAHTPRCCPVPGTVC